MSLFKQLAEQAPTTEQVSAPETNINEASPAVASESDVTEPAAQHNEPISNQDNPADPEPSEQKNDADPAPKRSRFANEELQKFNDFVLKTGKSWEDFQAFNKPTAELDSSDLLRQYYSEKEGMTEKEVNYELKRLIVDEEDPDYDFMDEADIEKREIELERELRKAREWREDYVHELSKDLGTEPYSDLSVEEYQKEMAELQKKSVSEYRETVYTALADIKPMELEINGEKVQFVPDEDFRKNLKAAAEDLGVATNEYFDDAGKLTNADGWLEFVSWAHKPTRDAKLKAFAEQAVLRDRAEQSKLRRNVTPDAARHQPLDAPADNERQFMEWRGQRNKSPFGL